MTTSAKPKLVFVETNAQGKTVTRPIVGKVTTKAQSGFNYTVVEEVSSRPPAKVSLRRSGDTLIIEQDGAVVSEVENFYGEKAVTFTTDGSPTLTGSNSYITPNSTPVGPLPGGDTLVWAGGDGSGLMAGMASGQTALAPLGLVGLVGLVAGGGGGQAAATTPTPGPDPEPSVGGLGLVTDDGIGGATVTIKYFDASGVQVATDTVLSNDDPTDPAFGTFAIDLEGLGYDGTGFITASAVGGRDVNGNALNGAVVYQVLVTDALMGDVDAGADYQIVLSPLTTIMFQSVVSALGGGLGDSEADIAALLGGAADLDASVGIAAAEIADLFGLGAYGADPLTLLNTASSFDPTRQAVERQVNLLLVTLSALGSGLSDGGMVDDDTMALAKGASSAAALSVLNALSAARVADPEAEFSAGDRTFVQSAVVNFLNTVDEVPEVAAITTAGGNANGLRADGGDGTDASTARIAAAIAGLGALLEQGGENAILAMALVAGGDMLPEGRTALADLFANAFTAATDPSRAGFAADLEFDPTELEGSPDNGVFILDGVDGTGATEALDTFSTDIADALEEIYANGDFASVVVNHLGAFLDIKRDGVVSSQDADANNDGTVDDLTEANFANGGNASLAELAVTVVYTDTASSNEDFQAGADPLALIDENDRIEIRVQNYDYSDGTYGCTDTDINPLGTIGATELQYILDKGAETTAGVSITVSTTVPGNATLLLGTPETNDDVLASGTVRSILVDAHSDATESQASDATAVIAFNGEVTGSTFVQAMGQSSDANLILVADSELTLRTLGALADGDDSNVRLINAVGNSGSLTVTGNLLIDAAGDRSSVGGFSEDWSEIIGSLDIGDSALIGGAGDITFGGLVTVEASGAEASADLLIGSMAGGSITVNGDVLVEASGFGAAANLTVGAAALSSDAVEVRFDGGLEVLASGVEASAHLELRNANISAQDLHVTASGSSSDAQFNASTGITGSINGITITASGYSADASADIQGTGNCGDTLTIGGAITLTASGYSSDAYLYLEDVVLDGATVSVTASEYRSYASADISAASGTINNVTVQALAPSGGDQELQGFDFFGATLQNAGVDIEEGTTVSVTINGLELSYTFDADDVAAYGCGDISGLVVSLNAQAAGIEALPVDFSDTGIMPGLYIEYTDYSNHALATVTVTDVCGDAHTFGNAYSTANHIDDGDGDAYDSGNYISTSACGDAISYLTDMVVTNDFGAGSERVVVYQDAVFGLMVTGNMEDMFSVSGNMGADGNGTEDLVVLDSYGGYSATVCRTHSAGDPSVNRLFIYQTNPDVLVAGLDGDTDTDDFTITGLDGVARFGYFVAYGDNDTALTESQLQAFLAALVDNVIGEGSAGDMRDAFYANFSSLTNALPALNANFELDGSGEDVSDFVELDGGSSSADNYAQLNLSGDVTIAGNLTVEAVGGSSAASADLTGISFAGSAVAVTASGRSSEATLYADNLAGTLDNVNVTASDASADADADITGSGNCGDTLTIGGSVMVTASAFSADAQLYLEDVVFDGSALTVTASGNVASADLEVYSASGTISAITVTASGDNGDNEYAFACGDITVTSGETLTVEGDVAVTASGTLSEAFLYMNGVGFDGSSVTVSATARSAEVYASFDVALGSIDGVTVTASGNSTYAYGDIAGSVGSHEYQAFNFFALNMLSGGDVVIETGTTVSLTVDGQALTYTFDEESVAAYVNNQEDISSLLISLGQQAQVLSLNVEFSNNGGIGISFTDLVNHDASTLSVTDAGGDVYTFNQYSGDEYSESDGRAGVGPLMISGLVEVLASGQSAESELYLADAVLDGATVSVTASGGSSDAQLYAYTGMTGSINGITITASCSDAYASADIEGTGNCGDTLTIGGAITLTASGDSSNAGLYLADAVLDGATVSVTASGYDSDAELYAYSGISGTVTSITVTASGSDAYASADAEIRGSSNCGDTLTVCGDITVTALGESSDAGLDLADVVLDGATVSVTASGGSSDAELYASSDISGTVTSITVTASGFSSVASADIAGEDGQPEVQIFNIFMNADLLEDLGGNSLDTVVVSFGDQDLIYTVACGDYAEFMCGDFSAIAVDLQAQADAAGIDVTVASDSSVGLSITYNNTADQPLAGVTLTSVCGDIYTFDPASSYVSVTEAVDPASLTVTNAVTVTASGESSDAYLELRDTVLDGITVTVDASGASSEAVLDASYGMSGTITELSVTATGGVMGSGDYGAIASADIGTGGWWTPLDRSALTIDHLTLQASGLSSEAYAVLTNLTLTQNLGASDLEVLATGASSEANLWTYSVDATANNLLVLAGGPTAVDGIYTRHARAEADFGDNSNLDVLGDITVAAYGNDGDARLDVSDGSHIAITDARVTVVAAAFSSDADMYLESATGQINEFTVTATGDSSEASAFISGDVQFGTIFTVTAAGHSSDASAEVQGGSNSEDVAGQDMNFVSTALLVQATGSSSEASLSVLDGTGNLASVTVTASGYSADAYADMDFSGTLAGDINVTASAFSSEASLSMTAGRRAELQVTAGSYNYSNGQPTGIQGYNSGDVVLLSIGGTDYSYTVQSGDDFYDVTAGLQTALAADGITVWHDYYNNSYYTGFTLIWDEQGYLETADREVSLSVTRFADQTVVAGAYNYWSDNGRGADANLIVLGVDTDVLVTASGFSSDAYVNLDYLSGVVDHVTVSATGSSNFSEDGTDADAWLRFDAHAGGHITTGLIETGDYANAAVSSTATLRLSQTDFCGDVTVTGDGFAKLVIRSEDVQTIDLSGLHSGAGDRWGVLTLEFAQEDRALTAGDFDENSVMTISCFDVSRDAFNNISPYQNTSHSWGDDNSSGNNVYYFEDESAHTASSGETVTGYETFSDLATWATGLLDARADTTIAGYVFGTYSGDGYLFYDQSGGGLTDVVKLEGVTSFDEINVAQRIGNDQSYSTGTENVTNVLALTSLDYYRQNSGSNVSNYGNGARELVYSNARIEDMHVSGYGSSASLSVGGAMATTNQLVFRQAEANVTSRASDGGIYGTDAWNNADANLTISNASGAIDHLNVSAHGGFDYEGNLYYCADASAQIDNSNLELRELSVLADYHSCADAHLNDLSGNVQQVTISVGEASYASAYIGVSADALSHIERIDFNADGSYCGDWSEMSLSVYQGNDAVGADGGVVYARAEGSGDLDVNLVYFGGGRAGEIHLGGEVTASGDTTLFNFDENGDLASHGCGDVTNRGFNLSMDVSDADLAVSTPADVTQLVDDRLQIWGSDLGTLNGNDTIRFTSSGGLLIASADFTEDLVPDATMADFLAAADSALNGTTDFYFGVVGGDGYLAYDDDGTGITMLIEFNGMTTFYEDRLFNYGGVIA